MKALRESGATDSDDRLYGMQRVTATIDGDSGDADGVSEGTLNRDTEHGTGTQIGDICW